MTDIVDKTHKLYKAMGVTYVGQPSWTWTFPSGAKIRLAYISTDKDIWEYLGPRYSFIGFDESTFHSESSMVSIFREPATPPKKRVSAEDSSAIFWAAVFVDQPGGVDVALARSSLVCLDKETAYCGTRFQRPKRKISRPGTRKSLTS